MSLRNFLSKGQPEVEFQSALKARENDQKSYIRHLSAAADLGHAEAQLMYSKEIVEGRVPGKTKESGLNWALKSAQANNAAAMCYVGNLYMYGHCGDQDLTEAIHWLEKARSNNYAPASIDLGYIYAKGMGGSQDYGKSILYYKEAAAASEPNACFNLGVMYLKGQGVAKDLLIAYEWFAKAELLGNSRASAMKQMLSEQLMAIAQERQRNVKRGIRQLILAGSAESALELVDQLEETATKEVQQGLLTNLAGFGVSASAISSVEKCLELASRISLISGLEKDEIVSAAAIGDLSDIREVLSSACT